MFKIKFGYKIWAVITFVIVSLAVIFSGFNMTKIKVNATTTENEFVKHVYATDVTTTYTLPVITTTNMSSLSRGAINDYIESRPLASNYEGVVEINGVGTGFIIGENTVMTALHCVYSKPEGATIGTFSENCTIKIPMSNQNTNTNSITADVISAHISAAGKNIVDNLNYFGIQDYDYAILTVDVDDLGLSESEKDDGLLDFGSFLLGMVTNDFASRAIPVHCMGYYNDTIRISHVNYQSSLPVNMGSLSFDFNLTTYFKTSGGPIYTESVFGVAGAGGGYGINTYRTAISITSAINENNANQIITMGTRIRPEIMQFAYGNSNL